MAKKQYLLPEIRIRKIDMESLLGGSITGIDDGGSGGDGPGYGGGNTGPAYAPEWGSIWEDYDEADIEDVWEY